MLNRCSSRISHRLQRLWESEQKSEKGQIYFDDLGINTLFVDEAHNFKNISIETKHGSLPGLNTKGSKRCDDMMAKIRYVQRHNDGRGAVFATGTPITNSVSDLYTMQRYLGFDRMDRLNLAEFDNWVKMFSEVTEEFEVGDVNECFVFHTNDIISYLDAFADVLGNCGYVFSGER